MRRALLIGAAALTGCGGTATAPLPGREAPPAPSAQVRATPVQVANGPLAAARTPLSVQLARADDRVRLRFGRPPKSGLLFDLDTGEVLWRREPLAVRPVASLTKMLTALVVADRVRPDARVRFTEAADRVPGSRVGLFRRGRHVRAETLLHGLMLVSGNDAAVALAQHAGGSLPGFVEAMNDRARAMGLACSHFATPYGLSRADRSCAADLAALARAVVDHPRLARIVRTRQAVLPFPIKGGRLFLTNTNPLLRARLNGVLGIKTGYTVRAGRCLVAAVRRGGRRLGVVLLGSPDPGRQARMLFNRAGRVARTGS